MFIPGTINPLKQAIMPYISILRSSWGVSVILSRFFSNYFSGSKEPLGSYSASEHPMGV
jgi:hypothetical protein